MKTSREPQTAAPWPAASMAADVPGNLNLTKAPDENNAQALAHAALTPAIRAAFNIREYSRHFGQVDINTLAADLAEHGKRVNAGDLQQAELMLYSQAQTLDAVFGALLQRATVNMDQNLEAADMLLRVAFKAQSQCRATIETLALVKHPKAATFIRQANVAHGPQQINNRRSRARAGKRKRGKTKLLERANGKRLEHGAAPTSGFDDSAMAAMEAIDRAEDASRESDLGAQRLQGRLDARKAAAVARRARENGGHRE
jgi:hypothetical protein